MKISLTRIFTICLINFLLNYLLLFPLGLYKYLETKDLSAFGLFGILISAVPVIGTLLFYKFIDKKSLRTLGFHLNRKDLLFSFLSIALTVILYFIYIMVLSNSGVIHAQWNTEVFTKGSFYGLFLLIFLSWFVAAFYEEILFRGYFVANLKKLSPKKLYVATSIIFMIFHIFRGLDPINIVILMLMSCVFLYIYLQSGSLFPSTFAHLIFNFTSGHLVGSSDISILTFNEDPGVFNLIIIVVYMIVQIVLTRTIYGRKVNNK
ncbi:CPBP family intramembrane glutamic endopeptidase [Bacillus sp. CGMCC 1.16607]|uniref:CPBP family intramembrane glutamic endopeptidase n=1 Tax=Bacillus sp. CGMCC 1.16607 TaxID=3351842 RepID=UPI00363D7BCD